jgi:hypothetical protein
LNGWTLSLSGALERQRALSVNATPATGHYEPTIAASSVRERRGTFSFDRPTKLGPLGFETQLHFDATLIQYRGDDSSYHDMSRFAARGNFERPVGGSRFVARSLAAWVAGGESLPAQHLAFIGGPTSAPGYVFHQYAGRAALSQRLEIQFPVPFASMSLGRYGKTPASMTLAPFANFAWVDKATHARVPGQTLSLLAPPRSGWHPSIGIGALTIFELVRFDVARGLRDGRWTFNVDVSRDLWSIL